MSPDLDLVRRPRLSTGQRQEQGLRLGLGLGPGLGPGVKQTLLYH